MPEKNQVSRRGLLRTGAALAAGTMFGGAWSSSWKPSSAIAAESGSAASSSAVARSRKRALRIAHLTDVHVQPELAADRGLIACLHHVQSHDDKPELILNGGDAIFDSLHQKADRTAALWKLWRETWKQECSIPLESCIGNHDIWGWSKQKSGATGDEPNYGKLWSVEALGLTNRYHSFDRGGWHFVAIDGVQTSKDRLYEGRLDEEQFEWLKNDLAKVDSKTPVCVFSHIPIVCAGILFFAKDKDDDLSYRVSGSTIHADAPRIKNLFAKHPNVRLCLSGHVHLTDRLDYNGVTYLCNGAVSGSWWKGKHHDCDNGYAMIDLYDDGTFEHEYVCYGWQPVTA